jgi:hypothetical protein
MSISRMIDWLDDWINPIVIKELRQAVKSRVVTSVLLLFLGVQLLIVGMFLGFQEVRSSDPMNSRTGIDLFVILQGILLGTCMVLIPTYAAIRMSNERSDTNVDLLFISTLRPISIIAGKFFSALVLAMLVFSCCAPFMTFTYLLRGIDIPTILFVLGMDVLAILLSTQFGLFLASMPVTRVFKFILFFIAFLVLVYSFAGLQTGTYFGVQQGTFGDRSGEFWAVVGLTTLGVLFLTGLLFFWSVALISPPSANRALMGRLFLVFMWLIMGAGCIWVTTYTLRTGGPPEPLMVWMAFSVLFFCLQLVISINERDAWGPRVARTIPRSLVLRPVALLFYSGSAGGVFLSMICITLTLLFGWIWRETYPPTSGFPDLFAGFLQCFGALALYTFCYGMSAVLLRAYLFRNKIRSTLTWVVALLLLGLGSTVPWIGAYLFRYDIFSYHYSGLQWWWLPNPFWSLGEVAREPFSRSGYFTEACFLFLGAWALLLAILSVPWVFQQFTRFRRYTVRPKRKTAVASTRELDEPVMVTPIEAG